ncbi:MAG: hypothetical protein JXR56_05655 [Candidatus Cloacimonetes bacterium]|nr:hypothetical protein [Candidatus Cloacimonadota bacterium]
MQFIKSLVILLLLLLLTSCFDYSDEGKYWSEEWIATMNIDGSDIEFLTKGNRSPYYVADLDNPGEEKVIIDNYISVSYLNEDGTIGDYVLTDVGKIVEISHDRTKMVMEYNQDIYIANVDGTDLRNITNTPDIREHDASISVDNTQIVYSRYIYSQDVRSESLIIYNLIDNTETELIREQNDNIVFFGSSSIVFNKVFYFKNSSPVITPTGLYCYDIETGIDSLIYEGFVFDVITDYKEYVYIHAYTVGILQFDIVELSYQLLFANQPLASSSVLSLDQSSEFLCVSNNNSIAIIYNKQTAEYIYLPNLTSRVSFNRESIKIISVFSRRHPDDF